MPVTKNEDFIRVTEDSVMDARIIVVHKGLQLRKKGLNPSSRVNILKAARALGFQGRTCDALLRDMETKYPALKKAEK